jgi:hypothetical protein
VGKVALERSFWACSTVMMKLWELDVTCKVSGEVYKVGTGIQRQLFVL